MSNSTGKEENDLLGLFETPFKQQHEKETNLNKNDNNESFDIFNSISGNSQTDVNEKQKEAFDFFDSLSSASTAQPPPNIYSNTQNVHNSDRTNVSFAVSNKNTSHIHHSANPNSQNSQIISELPSFSKAPHPPPSSSTFPTIQTKQQEQIELFTSPSAENIVSSQAGEKYFDSIQKPGLLVPNLSSQQPPSNMPKFPASSPNQNSLPSQNNSHNTIDINVFNSPVSTTSKTNFPTFQHSPSNQPALSSTLLASTFSNAKGNALDKNFSPQHHHNPLSVSSSPSNFSLSAQAVNTNNLLDISNSPKSTPPLFNLIASSSSPPFASNNMNKKSRTDLSSQEQEKSTDTSLAGVDLDFLSNLSSSVEGQQTSNEQIPVSAHPASDLFSDHLPEQNSEQTPKSDPFTDLLLISPAGKMDSTAQDPKELNSNTLNVGVSGNAQVQLSSTITKTNEQVDHTTKVPDPSFLKANVNLENFPFRLWIQGSIFQDIPVIDTVSELGGKILTPLERPSRKIVQPEDLNSKEPNMILKTLLLHKSYRAVARYTKSLILSMKMNPTNIEELQRLFVLRWHSMAFLGLFPLIEHEMRTVGIDAESAEDPFRLLRTSEWYYESWQELYPGNKGHLISFEMTVFCAKWPGMKGNFNETISRLYFLLFDVEQGNKDQKSTTLYGMSDEKSELFAVRQERTTAVRIYIANAFIQMNDHVLAIKILESLSSQKMKQNQIFHIQNLLGRLYLVVGHVLKAEVAFEAMEKVFLGQPWIMSPDNEFDLVPDYIQSSEFSTTFITNKIFVLLAQDRYEDARQLYISMMSMSKLHPQERILHINNASILSLYTGHLSEAVSAIEQSLMDHPVLMVNQSILLFNLATLYDLSYHSQDRKKHILKNTVYPNAGDTFVTDCLKM